MNTVDTGTLLALLALAIGGGALFGMAIERHRSETREQVAKDETLRALASEREAINLSKRWMQRYNALATMLLSHIPHGYGDFETHIN